MVNMFHMGKAHDKGYGSAHGAFHCTKSCRGASTSKGSQTQNHEDTFFPAVKVVLKPTQYLEPGKHACENLPTRNFSLSITYSYLLHCS